MYLIFFEAFIHSQKAARRGALLVSLFLSLSQSEQANEQHSVTVAMVLLLLLLLFLLCIICVI
jgi:hypothetical protein